MQLVIEQASTAVDIKAIEQLEDSVFRTEKNISLMPLEPAADGTVFCLLARTAPGGQPVATLTVVETGARPRVLRRPLSIPNPGGGRVARYTRLAVLPDYRGQNLSMRLILEAHRRFVAPERIAHTWLLFDAARASSSLLSSLLGFRCGQQVIRSEHGLCRLLYRDEMSITSLTGNRRGLAYLTALADPAPAAVAFPPAA